MKCHTYAQEVISQKTLSWNTRQSYTYTVNKLIPKDLEMPLTEQKLKELLSKVINPNSRRSNTITLNSIFGLDLKKPKPVKWDGQMPSFEALDALIQSNPKIRMYGNLMLHAGFRIGETLVKQRIKGLGIMVENQMFRNGEISPAKSMGQVIPPTWLMDEYINWLPQYKNPNSVGGMFHKLFQKNDMPDMTAHKLRHCFATHYAKILSIEGLRKQMRHSSINVTMEYYVHVSDQDISSVMHTRPLRVIAN